MIDHIIYFSNFFVNLCLVWHYYFLFADNSNSIVCKIIIDVFGFYAIICAGTPLEFIALLSYLQIWMHLYIQSGVSGLELMKNMLQHACKMYKITGPGRFEKKSTLSNIQSYQVVSWVNRLMIRFLKSILAWSRHRVDAWTRSTKFTLSVILMNRLELFIIIKTIIDILSMVYHEKWFTNEPFMVSVVINGEARLTGLNYFIRLQDRFSEFMLGLGIQSSLSEHTLITENIPRCKINYKLCE